MGASGGLSPVATERRRNAPKRGGAPGATSATVAYSVVDQRVVLLGGYFCEVVYMM